MPSPDVSIAINVRTGEEAALSGIDCLAGIAADFSVLGIDAPAIKGRAYFDDHKRVHDTMDAHGWVFVQASRHFHYGLVAKIEPVSSEDLAGVLQTLVDRVGAVPDGATVILREAGAVDLAGGDILDIIGGEPIPDAALARCAGRAGRVASIMDTVAAAPYAGRVTVFGSVARGKPYPDDLDIMVDLRDGAECDLDGLLRLARESYGSFDPHVLTEGGLYARDEAGLRFARVRSPGAVLAAIRGEGIPLARAQRPTMALPEPAVAGPAMA